MLLLILVFKNQDVIKHAVSLQQQKSNVMTDNLFDVGEWVWIKHENSWSLGSYIGADAMSKKYIARRMQANEDGKIDFIMGNGILPYKAITENIDLMQPTWKDIEIAIELARRQDKVEIISTLPLLMERRQLTIDEIISDIRSRKMPKCKQK